jgi:hypothetical protein
VPPGNRSAITKGLIAGCVVAVLASTLFGLIVQSGYPFVLASAEARASLEVTAEQLAELKSARLASDCVAFAMMGGLLAASVLSARLLTRASDRLGEGLVPVAIAILIGLVGGVVGAILATWFDESVDSVNDPMTRSSLRTLLLLVPPAVAVAIGVAICEKLIAKIPDILLAALVGVVIALGLNLILHGTLTTFEASPPLMPERGSNRLLLAFALLVPATLTLTYALLRSGGPAAGSLPVDVAGGAVGSGESRD